MKLARESQGTREDESKEADYKGIKHWRQRAMMMMEVKRERERERERGWIVAVMLIRGKRRCNVDCASSKGSKGEREREGDRERELCLETHIAEQSDRVILYLYASGVSRRLVGRSGVLKGKVDPRRVGGGGEE